MIQQLDQVQDLAAYRISKARECYSDAQAALMEQRYSTAANRSYYAIFHAVRALLAFGKFDSKRHSTIIGYFHREYIATGKIPREYHLILTEAFHMRMETDYNDFFVISREETDEQVSKALVFIEYIEVVIAGLQVPAQNN
ncbi:MAG: HEPN domain-containing protein [Bacillota bacterium]